MLERLDHVDWSSLSHAYGAATDVPLLIRSLLSPDSTERKQAVNALFGNIWHQGTVYPATAAAVPFLYELLIAPGVQDKSKIACLLASIASGSGYLEVHAASDWGASTYREILGRRGRTLEAELERERAETASVRRAASDGLLHLIPYLYDNEPETRRAVAEALGKFPDHAGRSLPAIAAAQTCECDDEVCAALDASRVRLARGSS